MTPAATTARKRDELFDALIEELNVDPAELTTAARGSLNNALKQLREVGATPLQIHSRCRRFRRRYADARLTPAALAKHWPDLATEGPPGSAQASPHPAGWEFGMGGVPWTPKVAD